MRLSQENFVPARFVLDELGVRDIVGIHKPLTVENVSRLAQISTVDQTRILDTHLGSFSQQTRAVYTTPFFTPSRRKAETSVQFRVCPNCLSDHQKPHILLRWALEMVCLCPIHRVPLLEICPKCSTTFNINSLIRDNPLASCWKCNCDLRQYKQPQTHNFDSAIAFQEHLLQLKIGEVVLLPQARSVSSENFVRIVQKLFLALGSQPLFQSFSRFFDTAFRLQIQLLDDTFSTAFRHTNALSICAWIFANPIARLLLLEEYVQLKIQHTIAVRLLSAFRRVQESIRLPNTVIYQSQS